MQSAIRFLLGDELRELSDVDPHTTVLNYLRDSEGLTGTKEGCAEGDCGACTVVLATSNGAELEYQAVNACILFLPTLHGKQLITVEHLQGGEGQLHPVQQAMVDSHASQCGFCTPGFVMSLYALYQQGGAPSRRAIDDALAGNLCRCTGYGPIVDAARQIMTRGGGQATDQAETVTRLNELAGDGGVALSYSGLRYFAPRTIDQLADLVLAHPEAVLVAGATDVGLWVTKQLRRFDEIIYLGDVEELKQLRVNDGVIDIGAAVPYIQAHDLLARHWPDVGEVIRRLGSVQIRNVGTIGGNIANGSPIGDSPPLLIALDATLLLRRGQEQKKLPLEDYFLDYGKQDRRPGEFVEAVQVPLPKPDWQFRAYKISKRFDQDISAVLAAFHMRIVDGRIAEARVAYAEKNDRSEPDAYLHLWEPAPPEEAPEPGQGPEHKAAQHEELVPMRRREHEPLVLAPKPSDERRLQTDLLQRPVVLGSLAA